MAREVPGFLVAGAHVMLQLKQDATLIFPILLLISGPLTHAGISWMFISPIIISGVG